MSRAAESRIVVGGTEWMADAACKGRTVDMFPNTGAGVVLAQQVCAECPVREACGEYALANGIDHGVWGGMSERERRRRRARRPRAVRATPEPEQRDKRKIRQPVGTGDEAWHGTLLGYRNQGCGCERCRAANRDMQRRYAAQRRGEVPSPVRPTPRRLLAVAEPVPVVTKRRCSCGQALVRQSGPFGDWGHAAGGFANGQLGADGHVARPAEA